MDLTQQVKNFEATEKQARSQKVVAGRCSQDLHSHHSALQQLSNGDMQVAYAATLVVVQHEGARAPRVQSAHTRKPPGYVRNESGGMFTS